MTLVIKASPLWRNINHADLSGFEVDGMYDRDSDDQQIWTRRIFNLQSIDPFKGKLFVKKIIFNALGPKGIKLYLVADHFHTVALFSKTLFDADFIKPLKRPLTPDEMD